MVIKPGLAAPSARGVAEDTPSRLKVVIAPLKPQMSSTTRAVMAGLAKFWPMPPKSCLTTTMAMTLPRAAIHRGMS